VDGQESWITTGNGTSISMMLRVEVDKTPQHADNEHSDFTYGRQPDGKDTDTRADFGYTMPAKALQWLWELKA